MNTHDKPRQSTKTQIREPAKFKPSQPSSTIQSEPLSEPKVQREEIAAPEDPKTSAQKRQAARYERILREHERESESPMTLSGLTDKKRRQEKKWLKQEGDRLRAITNKNANKKS